MTASTLLLGWAETDITPPRQPVLITGQFHARLSEGVNDPLSATVMAMQLGGEEAVFVTADLVTIPDPLRDEVRKKVKERLPEFPIEKIILNATHTHTGPEVRVVASNSASANSTAAGLGVELGEVPVAEYLDFLTAQLGNAIVQAVKARQPATIAYGLDYTAVARNRRWVDDTGKSIMYGLNEKTADRFRHIEGYEDQSLNLLATYTPEGKLTGIVVNIASPSQETEGGFQLSADFWHETRQELRKRLGKDLFILPQCSAAGDITSHLMLDKRANERMQQLRNRTFRQEIALRIADTVDRILPVIEGSREVPLRLTHRVETLQLPINKLRQKDVDDALREAETLRLRYEEEKARLEADPSLKQQPRWYVQATRLWRRMNWYKRVAVRYEKQKTEPTTPAELHVVTLGDIAFVTNPYELYVDYGLEVKLRSPAVQTFVIQLAGGGSYLPSPRSVGGGGYGSVPASNLVGPEAGRIWVEETVKLLRETCQQK